MCGGVGCWLRDTRTLGKLKSSKGIVEHGRSLLSPQTPATTQPPGITPSLLSKANTGDATSQRLVAEAYKEGRGVLKDNEEAYVWYRKAATGGDAESQLQVGFLYWVNFKIQGDAQDGLQAELWLRRAAEQGHALHSGISLGFTKQVLGSNRILHRQHIGTARPQSREILLLNSVLESYTRLGTVYQRTQGKHLPCIKKPPSKDILQHK